MLDFPCALPHAHLTGTYYHPEVRRYRRPSSSHPLSAPKFTCCSLKPVLRITSKYSRHSIFNQLMASRYSLLLLSVIAVQASASSPPLQLHFYQQSCPRAEAIVRQVVHNRAAQDRSVLPALIRLQFHDCFVRVRTSSEIDRVCSIAGQTRHVGVKTPDF